MSELDGISEDWTPPPTSRFPSIPLTYLVQPGSVRRGEQFAHFNLTSSLVSSTYRRLDRSNLTVGPWTGTFLNAPKGGAEEPTVSVLLTSGASGRLSLNELGIVERDELMNQSIRPACFTVYQWWCNEVMILVDQQSRLR